MKVDVTQVGSFQKAIQITVPAGDVRSELDAAFRQLSHRVRLRGFRPGKAPRRVLEAQFGDQVKADVANNLIQSSYSTAIEEHDIEPVGQPNLSDTGAISSKDDFVFTITVDVKPEIALDTYKGVEVVYPTYLVTDDELEAAVKARLEGQARLVEVEDRPVEKGDMVLISLLAKDGDDEVANEQGTMIRTEGDPYYPGIEDLLVGLKKDQKKTKKVAFSDDARIEEIAGRELKTSVQVISIQANEIPELDDDLATELGYEGGATGMRAAIKAQLDEGRSELARNQARANLLEALIAANDFEVPTGMIDQSLQMLMDELKLQEAYRSGRDPRNIHFGDAQVADLRMRAAFASKAGLILEFVSKTEKVEITDADLEAKYRELADARGQTLEAVKGYFVKDEAVDELKDRMLEEKTLDWLLERATLVDPPPEAEAEAEPEEKPKKKAKKAKKPAAEAPADGPDLSVLEGSVKAIKEAVGSGAHDADLDALEAAEDGGKARKGALEAIRSRKAAL